MVLDSGSLTLFCAQAMPRDRDLVVVTNNLPAAQYLADFDNLQIFTLPGMIRGLTSAAVDSWTSRRLATLTADLAIIGVNGLTTTQGLTTTNPEEAATKRAMMLSARRRVVPVISGKLGRNSFCSFASVERGRPHHHRLGCQHRGRTRARRRGARGRHRLTRPRGPAAGPLGGGQGTAIGWIDNIDRIGQ